MKNINIQQIYNNNPSYFSVQNTFAAHYLTIQFIQQLIVFIYYFSYQIKIKTI
jgi:hypothetical protein